MSYYALFQWWLLLSQHPGCLCNLHILSHLARTLGTLADGLGCFPLDYEAYPSQSDSRITVDGIRSLIEFGNLVGPLAQSVLYLHDSNIRR